MTSELLRLVRLGKQERALLLAANADTLVPIPGWRTERRRLSVISRAVNRLVRLKLVERHYDWWKGGCEKDDTNSLLVTRRGKDGFETTYREYIGIHTLKLTPLGAAVVNQFRDALTSGKRIRWAKFNPPSEALPPPDPPPGPTGGQKELKQLKDFVENWGRVERGEIPDPITERMKGRKQALEDFTAARMEQVKEELEKLTAWEAEIRETWPQDLQKARQRIAELEAQGVTLP